MAGLCPRDCWECSLWEIHRWAEAAGEQAKDEMRRLAWHAANTINVWLDRKDRVTPAQLLGEHRAEPIRASECSSPAEFKARIAQLR